MNDIKTLFRGLLVSPPIKREMPYKEMPPLEFDPVTLDAAPNGRELGYLFSENMDQPGQQNLRVVNGALMLYEKYCTDPLYKDLSAADLFAHCFDTALIWERG